MTDTIDTAEKEYRIFVNGVEKTTRKEVLTYEEVVHFAYPDPGDKIYSVSFEKAKEPKEGELVAGQSVEIKEGTEFDVTPTGKS
jgi:hypothetical protein